MTRAEHLAWCKARALQYLDKGDVANAVTSMGCDMDKHPETKVSAALIDLGMLYIMNSDVGGAKRWIEGFR